MPLTWDARAVGDKPKTGIFNEKNGEWQRTDYLCFLLMAVDIREITKKNWQEVYGRIRMYETLFGSTFNKSCNHKTNNCKGHITDGIASSRPHNIPKPYTAKHIKDRIGYNTNNITKNKTGFLSHLWNSWGYEFSKETNILTAGDKK
tara:strand:+ start:118 stop:558 length:441 start_codon:yes stop_codon:yes gene_type:complete